MHERVCRTCYGLTLVGAQRVSFYIEPMPDPVYFCGWHRPVVETTLNWVLLYRH